MAWWTATIDGQTGIVTRQETPASVAEGIMALLKTPENISDSANRLRAHQGVSVGQILPPACDWLEKQAGRK